MTDYKLLKAIAERLRGTVESVRLTEIMRELNLAYGKVQELIKEFNSKEDLRFDQVGRQRKKGEWEKFVLPRATVPILQVREKLPHPEAPHVPTPIEPVEGRFVVRVDAYTMKQLERTVQEQLKPAEGEALSYMGWWKFLEKLDREERPEVFPTTFPRQVFVPKPTDLHKVIPHKRTWDILELRSFLQKILGVSARGAMMAEFEQRDGIKYLRLRRYRTPPELATGYGTVVELPVPKRRMYVIKWMSHGGKDSEEYKYHHEFNVYARFPRWFDEEEVKIAMRQLMRQVLDDRGYPNLNDILEYWHDADDMVTTTPARFDDGYWIQYYQGEVQAEGAVDEEDVKDVYREAGVM